MFTSISVSILIAGFTALLGLIVFVAGQFLLKLYIDPIQDQKRIRAEAAYALYYFYFNRRTDTLSQEDVREGQTKLRNLASELVVSVSTVPRYELSAKYGLVRTEDDIGGAAVSLIELAKTLGDLNEEHGTNRYYALRAREHLGIETPDVVLRALAMTSEQ